MSELFEFPGTRSQRVRWVLEELNQSYEAKIIDFAKGENQSHDYRAIHPLGFVPAYRTDAVTILESVAIVMQLIDEHRESQLAPEIGTPERATYYQWCVFGCAEMDYPIQTVTLHEKFLPEDARRPELAALARTQFGLRAQMLSDHLRNRDFILGSTFSGADIVLGHSCFWATFTGLLSEHPVLEKYLARLADRAGYQAAYSEWL